MNGALVVVGSLAVGAIGLTMLLNKKDSIGGAQEPDVTPAPSGVASGNPVDGGDVVGVALPIIKQFEGFSPIPYPDPPNSGKYSIGYGHQIQSSESLQHLDTDQAEALLNIDVSFAWGTVNENVKVPLNTNQAAALTSFAYNVGASAFEKSTLLRLLNNGDYVGAASQFARWDLAKGNVSSVLVSRRAQERDLFEA